MQMLQVLTVFPPLRISAQDPSMENFGVTTGIEKDGEFKVVDRDLVCRVSQVEIPDKLCSMSKFGCEYPRGLFVGAL